MTAAAPPRPTRLWVAAIMNILVAAISIASVAYLLLSTNPNIPASVRPGLFTTLVALGTAGSLVVASVLALLRVRIARWLMLAAALLFFGLLGYQSVAMLMWGDPSFAAGMAPRLWANVIRNIVEISINVWAIVSAATADFFWDDDSDEPLGADTPRVP
jgi:hypothetical protein